MAQNDGGRSVNGGTGRRFGHILIIFAGLFALAATLVTALSVWLQAKNYRKPLLQRYVIRILFIVPFFSAASWVSLVSLKASQWIDPFRDVYEACLKDAFVIYAFFQLLINFIGGERALIILMHGRPPVSHIWPLSRFLPKVDISDPHTFLAIKRGILQYTWIKPILAVATIVMKATDTYKEGFIGLTSGYFWSGLIYNVSITISLYALAMFWICMSTDLAPFRPMPKFLCIKGIIFASYWQGFLLSILVWLGAIPGDVPGYTPDNLAAAIQDALICFEMPIFAVWHWYAFSWRDYADITISAARMPVKYAMRDACGARDLIQDAKETFGGGQYDYRYFDAGENVIAHEESRQRVRRMRAGMRYERGGKGKYWIPKPGADSKTPLLNGEGNGARGTYNGNGAGHDDYGTASDDLTEYEHLDEDDECLYTNARALEFGDWNYPVITAHHATREDRLYATPRLLTISANRNLLQPTKENRKRRKQEIKDIQESVDKGKDRRTSRASEQSEPPGVAGKVKKVLTAGSEQSAVSANSDPSQLVDLVVEDEDAEEVERVRARKEGSPEWNKAEPRHFVHTYPEDGQAEEVREGHEPDPAPNKNPDQLHTVDTAFSLDDIDESGESSTSNHGEGGEWIFNRRDYTNEEEIRRRSAAESEANEQNVWRSPG